MKLQHPPSIRLLWPFYMEEGSGDDAAASLVATRFRGHPVWITGGEEDGRSHVPAPYVQELSEDVAQVLFGGAGARRGGLYLQVAPQVVHSWLNDVAVRWLNESLPVVTPACGIELFLSDEGAGLLSIQFEGPVGLDEVGCRGLVYRLSQNRRQSLRPTLRKSHLGDDPDRLAAVREKQPDLQLPPIPDPGAPLGERLGHRGGEFTLSELVEFLLSPAEECGLVAAQGDFSVFVALRVSQATAMSTTRELADGLALLEEPLHAGSDPESGVVDNVLLNRRHLIALGHHGCVHVVGDQEPPSGRDAHPYDPQRLPTVRDKYFVPFVYALLERTALMRIEREACRVLYDETTYEGFRKVHGQLLHLGVTMEFGVVSQRGAVQRCYELAVSSLRLEAHRRSARRVISDLADRHERDNQNALLEDTRALQGLMVENVEAGHHIHKALAWIEVLIVAVYGAELYHLVAPEGLSEALHGHMHVENLAAALLTGAVALAVVRPWRH